MKKITKNKQQSKLIKPGDFFKEEYFIKASNKSIFNIKAKFKIIKF